MHYSFFRKLFRDTTYQFFLRGSLVGLTTHLKMRKEKLSHWRSILLILVLIGIMAAAYMLPTPDGLSHHGQVMIGIMLVGGILWITELIPLAATGLLIMIIQPLLGTLPSEEVFSSFGNQAIFFLIGAFIQLKNTKFPCALARLFLQQLLRNTGYINVLRYVSLGFLSRNPDC